MNSILSWVISMFLSSPAKLQEILLGLLNNVNMTGNPGMKFAVEFAKGGVGSDTAMEALFEWVKGTDTTTLACCALPPDVDVQGTLVAIAAKQATATMFFNTVDAVVRDTDPRATNADGVSDYLRLCAEAIAVEADTAIDPVTIIAIISAIVQLIKMWRDRKNS